MEARNNMISNMNSYIDDLLKQAFQVQCFGVKARLNFNVIQRPSQFDDTNYYYSNIVITVKESGLWSSITGNSLRLGAFASTNLPAGQVLGVLQDEDAILTTVENTTNNLYYSFALPNNARGKAPRKIFDCAKANFNFGKCLIAFANVANGRIYTYTGTVNVQPNVRIDYKERGEGMSMQVSIATKLLT